MDTSQMIRAVIIGMGASVLMDLWNLFLKRAFGLPSLNYCLLGRWVLTMREGTFRHASIGAAPPQSRECAAGWAAHYTIGVSLAVGFVLLVPGWLARPALGPALLYGIGTVVFPFFLMQPALGLGLASAKAPKPAQARLKSLATHAVFGIGLYAGALAVNFFLQGRG